MRPIALISLLIAIWIAAVGSGYRPLYLMAYALSIGVMIGLVWSRLQISGLTVNISRLNFHPKVGRSINFRITVKENWGIPRSKLHVELSGEGMSKIESVIDLMPKQSLTWFGSVQGIRRGAGTSGAVDLYAGDPMGITKLIKRLVDPISVLIHPATVKLNPSTAGRYGMWREGEQFNRYGRESITAARVREYITGDNLNHMHWPSIAKTGRLMTKEFESGDTSEDLWILLDMNGVTQVGAGPKGTEETAITLAASIVQMLIDAGKSVGIAMAGNDRYFHSPERGNDQLERIMKSLALVRATGQVDLADLFARSSAIIDPSSKVIIIAPWPSQAIDKLQESSLGRKVKKLPILLDIGSFGRHGDARWIKNPQVDFEDGAYLFQRDDDPANALEYVIQELTI